MNQSEEAFVKNLPYIVQERLHMSKPSPYVWERNLV
jgi:hypothetical protein